MILARMLQVDFDDSISNCIVGYTDMYMVFSVEGSISMQEHSGEHNYIHSFIGSGDG